MKQAEFSKVCTALVKNAKAPELIRKVLEQRETILKMESAEGDFLFLFVLLGGGGSKSNRSNNSNKKLSCVQSGTLASRTALYIVSHNCFWLLTISIVLLFLKVSVR